MREILRNFTAAVAGALLLGLVSGCPFWTMQVSAEETDGMMTGNAAAETAIAMTSTDTMGLADNQEALAEYLIQLQEIIEQQTAALGSAKEQQTRDELASQTRSKSWTGSVLNRVSGVNVGPSGKETYYNLNMTKIVSAMKKLGVNSEYWVRDDGVKMYGDYIMCAANLSVYPRGSIVETSLGTGIVCDTGAFAKNSSIVLDIATAW